MEILDANHTEQTDTPDSITPSMGSHIQFPGKSFVITKTLNAATEIRPFCNGKILIPLFLTLVSLMILYFHEEIL